MKNVGNYFVQLSTFLLILLWVYAAVSKLIDFPHFQQEMHNQMLFPFIQTLLIYFLPVIEIATAAMLIFDRAFMSGLYSSLILMILFTGYISLALLHFFRHVPCSCGGVLEHMGWTVHLFFNLFFLALTLITIYISNRKEQL
jgi:hypothetical protein